LLVLTQVYLISVHQAGEDLEETEDEDEESIIDEEQLYAQASGSQGQSDAAQDSLARILADAQPSKPTASETSPLLPRTSSLPRSRMKRRRVSVSHGDATVGQAVLMVCHPLPCYFTRPRNHFFS
jgi:proton-coupled amino acid transporter